MFLAKLTGAKLPDVVHWLILDHVDALLHHASLPSFMLDCTCITQLSVAIVLLQWLAWSHIESTSSSKEPLPAIFVFVLIQEGLCTTAAHVLTQLFTHTFASEDDPSPLALKTLMEPVSCSMPIAVQLVGQPSTGCGTRGLRHFSMTNPSLKLRYSNDA